MPFALAASLVVFGDGVVFHNDVDLKKALKSAAGGGIAGALAMVIQVLTLMPLRTIMNYRASTAVRAHGGSAPPSLTTSPRRTAEYRFGGTLRNASSTLWADGKVPRLYAGLAAALFQGPLSRFGDTAANAGIIALLESVDLPVLVKTVFASAASATFRMTLTPIDALKVRPPACILSDRGSRPATLTPFASCLAFRRPRSRPRAVSRACGCSRTVSRSRAWPPSGASARDAARTTDCLPD